MRVFVAGATGVIGKHLVPRLVAECHEVTGTTRSPAKAAGLQAVGATPAIVDGLDREAVLKAVTAAQPEVIVHQMTALASMSSFRHFDKEFAVTNELRVKGTDYLLGAAREAGTRRFIAQSFIGWNNTRTGSLVKTEQDPLDPGPVSSTRQRPGPGTRVAALPVGMPRREAAHARPRLAGPATRSTRTSSSISGRPPICTYGRTGTYPGGHGHRLHRGNRRRRGRRQLRQDPRSEAARVAEQPGQAPARVRQRNRAHHR